ncbi:DUF1553 domain-containing protein [Roseiconus lacunae]|uniref:DUF1553 domain-containing protein n=1 Tax=Roseiconus lacunae TaxID=2605694 RepID=A0ABT7PLK5_9BACT|nr:DUF1553 domain-containing protein [Roseiconus lacunae]MDM4017377.1 DUF1553 domain-containing protein [Roseiconus lacunae]
MSLLRAATALVVAFIVMESTGHSLERPPERSPEKTLERFEEHIQPLLAKKCGRCHGDRVQKGELNLATLAGIRQGGESGEPAVGETLDESPLWYLIESEEMPPEGLPRLTEDEKQSLKQWIASADLSAVASETKTPLHQHDVLPIVLLRCVTCHGAQRQDGDLDLRSVAGMKRGGQTGPALQPGDAEQSLMIQRIESEACPPSDLLLKFFVRRPTSSETEQLKKWINQGATELPLKPDVANGAPDPLVTDEDRSHWSFQPLPIRDNDSPSTSIDDFIGDRLRQHGLTLSPQADRDTLIRRVYLDLIGMPPTRQQWRYWRESTDPQWYARMVDQLLESPHYGERWGRYWLDLAGYADSEGGISADPIRPVAWKYRDYVIDAFNDDKPYDQFLLEQLAGDELVDYQNAETVTEEMVDRLVATGFLRMGIDETGSRTMNFVPERLKVISDAINIVSTSLMGLTMECARCHSHKYDPIPQRDYYRFKAIFQGAFDEHDWLSFKTRKINFGTDHQRQTAAKINPPLQRKIKQLQSKQKQAKKQLQLSLLRAHYPNQSDEDNELTVKALRIADNNRTLPQRTLVERLQLAELLPDSEQPTEVVEVRAEIERLRRQIDRLSRQLAPTLEIRALWDQGRPSPTYLLQRGEHNKPGRWVGPGVPAVLTDGTTTFEVNPPFPGGTAKTGRRLAFARWLIRPDHPLTARVMVNRIWHHHFGRGIVAGLDNFGRQGDRPTHPELLDWLSKSFVDNGWSVKHVHRLIMNSDTYRQSSRVTDQHREHDPDNQWFSRMNLRRLDAEALRDSLLFVSDRLDPNPGGLPDAVSVDRDGLVSIDPTPEGNWRRSVYLQYRRTEIPTMMDTFDYPPMGPNCLSRNVSTVSPQALLMMNNGHIHELSQAFAERIEAICSDAGISDDRSVIENVYGVLLTRQPNDDELFAGRDTLAKLTELYRGDRTPALQAYCHTLFNSAALLYVD